MFAPVSEPMDSRAWADFFNEVADGLGSEPPCFKALVNKQGYDGIFQEWCLTVQAAVNDIAPGAIGDPPLNEIAKGNRFGKAFTSWFNAVAEEI